MFRTVLGFVLAFAIGVMCRLLEIPLPAPPAVVGALLVVAMTLGHTLADRHLVRAAAAGDQPGDVQ